MQDIRLTLEEYEKSRKPIQSRIHELNAMISKRLPCKDDSGVRGLLERRTTLYSELWTIEHGIREMRDYIFNIQSAREVNKKVG